MSIGSIHSFDPLSDSIFPILLPTNSLRAASMLNSIDNFFAAWNICQDIRKNSRSYAWDDESLSQLNYEQAYAELKLMSPQQALQTLGENFDGCSEELFWLSHLLLARIRNKLGQYDYLLNHFQYNIDSCLDLQVKMELRFQLLFAYENVPNSPLDLNVVNRELESPIFNLLSPHLQACFYYLKARILMRLNHFNAAINTIDECLRTVKFDDIELKAKLWIVCARAHHHQFQFEETLNAANQGLACHPTHWETWALLYLAKFKALNALSRHREVTEIMRLISPVIPLHLTPSVNVTCHLYLAVATASNNLTEQSENLQEKQMNHREAARALKLVKKLNPKWKTFPEFDSERRRNRENKKLLPSPRNLCYHSSFYLSEFQKPKT